MIVHRFFFLFVVALLGTSSDVTAQTAESLKNRKELSLPFVEGKPVVAHFMTDLIYQRGVRQGDITSPSMYSPVGPSKEIGGMIQHYPMVAKLRPEMSLEEVAAYEMNAAKKLGIDGFQFYFPLSTNDAYMNRCVEIIITFFRVAEQKKLDFKLTLCLCNPRQGGTEAEKITMWSKYLGAIVSATKENPHWLKTPDGRYIFFHWIADSLPESVKEHWHVESKKELVADVAVAYEKLARRIELPIAWVYHLRWPKNQEHVEAVLDYFPAIWGWTDSYHPDDGWEPVAAYCRQRKRAYTQTVYPDYYTSKLYRRDKPSQMLFRYDEVKKQGIDNLERHYQVCHLSFLFRKLFERALKLDPPMINVATWNDYPEGHHLAPEINHNFGFSLLLQHYKARWRGESREENTEAAIVFFKKYRHDIEPKPFSIPIHTKASVGKESKDDVIEVVTLLKKSGQLWVNGNNLGKVEPGLHIEKIPSRPGNIHVTVTRNEKVILDFTTPEAITEKPIRTDRLTYSYSSEFKHLFKELFGDAKPFTSNEYGTKAENN